MPAAPFLPSVGPYMYVTADTCRLDGHRLVMYGALNAFGLIGSEHNGIAVLDEINKKRLADNLGRAHSGWYPGFGGPSPSLLAFYDTLLKMSTQSLLNLIEDHNSSNAP